MRKPLIAGNWKMNTNVAEAKQLANSMLDRLDKILDVDIVLCPPFISLYPVKEIINSSKIKLSAQNMYFVHHGAYTGEISPDMLQNVCDFVILGHSERRQYFFETDYLINKKN